MIYFLLFLISFLLSFVGVWMAKFFGKKFQLFDLPKEDPQKIKIHQKPTPFLGGLAMFLVFSTLFLGASYYQRFLDWKVWTIILAGFLLFVIGLWDDLKWKKFGVWYIKKFLFLILFSLLVTIILSSIGIKIQFLPGIWLGLTLTFFYILGAINAVNFEDGVDGLAGGMVAFSLGGFIILSIILGNSLALVISLVLLGTIFGFLIYNFPPAKIFMGDSGAYFLGYILVVLAAIFSQPYNIQSILGPIFIIGLPIFDTGLAIVRRLSQKKSPFLGDRSHFYDKMIQRGFSIKKTVLISYLWQFILIILGVVIYLYV